MNRDSQGGRQLPEWDREGREDLLLRRAGYSATQIRALRFQEASQWRLMQAAKLGRYLLCLCLAIGLVQTVIWATAH